MSSVGWDILLVLAVILIGGFFAAAEMALVSLREGQVRALGRHGKRGQRTAKLAQDPNRFLSSVQIGVTLATLLSGAFGAALLSDRLGTKLSKLMPRDVADPVALIAVTLVISFFTLVFGELAPKRLALQRNERVALVAGPVVDRLSMLARPLVWLLSKSTNVVVRLLGGDPAKTRGVMTDEELRDLVAGHQALSPDERHIVGEVFDAWQTPDPRGARAAYRGGIPSRSDAADRGCCGNRALPVLEVPGLPRVLRRRDRLRAHP